MDFEAFKKEIHDITGINLAAYKERQMKRRIDFLLMRKNIPTYDDYIKLLKANAEAKEEFMNYITINVSEFYRNPAQWEVLDKDIVAPMIQKGHVPRMWSAACSSGEEPYSIVMLLNKYLPFDKIRVDASDLDVEILKKAKEGLYAEQSLKNLSADMIKRYFDKKDGLYKIHDDVKACVNFKRQDLLKDEFPKEYYDIILCRNVVIYFTEEAKNLLYRKLYDALVPNGILFVGGTEQIILPQRFGFASYKPFFYQKIKSLQ